MPPKGWSAGREETEVKAVRIPASMIARIANHTERLQTQFRFGRVNEGMAIRDLLEIGLDTVEASAPLPSPTIPVVPTEVQQPLVSHETLTPELGTEQVAAAKSHRDLPEHIIKIAEVAAEYDRMSTRELAQLLYDRNIYRAIAAKTAEEKAVSPGTLARWLKEARGAGLL